MEAAEKYYDSCGGDAAAAVLEGRIVIGPPEINNNEQLAIIDGRYHIKNETI